MFIPRNAAPTILEKASQYPIIAITGPRQSGKSTLSKNLFPDKPYCNLEALDNRQFAQEDPRFFLAQYPEGAILDEVQHCPGLFSYLQPLVDEQKKAGQFILTGSQQFGLTANLTQSLAGRVGIVQLLPFSYTELNIANPPSSLEELLYSGFYPPIYDRNIAPAYWYGDYITTYLERDIRQLINVHDLRVFHRFLQMCAVRTGQILNLSNLASDCGISHNTAKAWISVLETSYIIYLVSPHFANFNKRLVKSPKLYFYDTGLASILAGIQHADQLLRHPLRGALFETWVMSELFKERLNHALLPNIYFWRDSQGHEVDCVIERGDQLLPVEIKAGLTINENYFSDLKYWHRLSGSTEKSWIVYAGEEFHSRSDFQIIGWKHIHELLALV